MSATKTFTIVDKINANTDKPFGDKYAGIFSIRRPSLLDKKNIAVKDAASMSFAGEIAAGTINDGIAMINYIFAYITTVATAPLPEWFNMATMYEPEDEDAVLAVWSQVAEWLATFRSKEIGVDGSGTVKESALLV